LKVPHPSEKSDEFFRSLIPDEPRVILRPMFGNLAGFVNGNLFAGLFGDSLFVRLSEKDRIEFQKFKDVKLFEPMQGRPMKSYFVVPKSWMEKPELVRPWISKALESTRKMPAKVSRRGKTKQ